MPSLFVSGGFLYVVLILTNPLTYMNNTHKNTKIVTIFRAGSFLSRAQTQGVEDFLSTTKKSIGSYWESGSSKRIGTGLTFPEEELLLPYLLDVPAEDREFRKKVSTFFVDIDTHVPHKLGRQLEIGLLEDNDKPLTKKNFPINVMDYIRYRHAMSHPFVAANKELADGNARIEFYIFDSSDVIKKNTKKTTEKDAAIQIYLQIKADETKVNSMLTVLGVDPREFVGPDAVSLKQEELRSLAEADAEKFTTAYNEADLDIRYWIKTMANTGVLKKIGVKYLDGETSKLIGNNEEETIFFFKDEENSETVALLKARMQEAIKKPAAKIRNR